MTTISQIIQISSHFKYSQQNYCLSRQRHTGLKPPIYWVEVKRHSHVSFFFLSVFEILNRENSMKTVLSVDDLFYIEGNTLCEQTIVEEKSVTNRNTRSGKFWNLELEKSFSDRGI